MPRGMEAGCNVHANAGKRGSTALKSSVPRWVLGARRWGRQPWGSGARWDWLDVVEARGERSRKESKAREPQFIAGRERRGCGRPGTNEAVETRRSRGRRVKFPRFARVPRAEPTPLDAGAGGDGRGTVGRVSTRTPVLAWSHDPARARCRARHVTSGWHCSRRSTGARISG